MDTAMVAIVSRMMTMMVKVKIFLVIGDDQSIFFYSPLPIDIQSVFLIVLVFLTNSNVNNVARNSDIAVIMILTMIAIFTKISNIIFNTAYTNLAIVARITDIISIIVIITNDIEKYYELPSSPK